MNAVLEVSGLTQSFGKLQVTKDVNLRLDQGDRVALIGPNGAGKTTLVNLITGKLRPTAGSIRMEGRDVTRLPVHRRAQLGIGRTYQITSLFRGMTVFENVFLAVSEKNGKALGLLRPASGQKTLCDETMDILETLELHRDAASNLASLPYGKQRLTELAIAIALRPRLLLLDEPAAGIPEHETEVILNGIRHLPDSMAVLMIDHDMDLVFRFAKRIVVLVDGAVFRDGAPAEIAADAEIKRIYLGE